MRRRLFFYALLSLAAGFVVAFAVFAMPSEDMNGEDGSEGLIGQDKNSKYSYITDDNLAAYLEDSGLLGIVPVGAAIELRTGGKKFLITHQTIREMKFDNPDIIVRLDSTYLPELANGFCSTLSEAYANGDLVIENQLSPIATGFKYGSLIQYADCLNVTKNSYSSG